MQRKHRSLFERLPKRWLAAGAIALLVVLVTIAGVAVSRRRLPPYTLQVMRLRALASYVDRYALRFHRPALYLDSVRMHLTASDRREFDDLAIDLWGDSVFYYWTYCGYKLSTAAGSGRRLDPSTFRYDSTTELAWSTADAVVVYHWPKSVGRLSHCHEVVAKTAETPIAGRGQIP